MSTQSERTGSEVMTGQDYERAKEVVRQFIEETDDRNNGSEVYASAVSYMTGWFKSKGSVPTDLLEYARKYSYEKAMRRFKK